jgi:hypothetical protein
LRFFSFTKVWEKVEVADCCLLGIFIMGSDDIEARPSDVGPGDDIVKAPVEVGRENIHATVPPHESYEGRHRFDPTASWSIAEERKVVRKTDLMLLTWLCVMVSARAPS